MPLQDYTTYIEVDPNNRITVATNKIDWAGLDRTDDAHVYKDLGVAFFNGDFVHDFHFQVDARQAGTLMNVWALDNEIGSFIDVGIDDSFSVALSFPSTNFDINLLEYDVSTQYSDFFRVAYFNGINYYLTMERDESIGTFGTLFCFVYSDSARTVLVDTMSIALHGSKKDWQYIYGVQAWNTTTSLTSTGFVEDLDLNLAVNTTTVGIVTAVDSGNHDIDVSMPYTNDDNNDSTYTIDYKLSADSVYTNHVTGASNTPSPYIDTITGLIGAETYDVKCTYIDPDGVTGTNPQTISDIAIEALPNKVIPKIVKNGFEYKVVKSNHIQKIVKRTAIDKVVK